MEAWSTPISEWGEYMLIPGDIVVDAEVTKIAIREQRWRQRRGTQSEDEEGISRRWPDYF